MGGLSLGDNLVIFNYFGECGLWPDKRDERGIIKRGLLCLTPHTYIVMSAKRIKQ